MRAVTILALVSIVLTGCAASPARDLESVEWLCFGTEHSRWRALDLNSILALRLMEEASTYEPLQQRQEPPRAVILVSSRQRHAALCRLGRLPSGKGCVAEKWDLFLDRYDRWFTEKHFAEECYPSEEVVVTS
jgi:hypothetical protein